MAGIPCYFYGSIIFLSLFLLAAFFEKGYMIPCATSDDCLKNMCRPPLTPRCIEHNCKCK
ncbi:putative Late nodulin [Medicago truncatula]|uniref:Nodule Cysteine-Rich (NCR) secreted peptide n=1 Tax=Medicago truncatula TaxID=3880 RepID=G7ZXD6_MEDTR|nr:Nodule Cysteine-Rich (NCR) secreted peptide [Medicago truncatula]RHN51890.1 putative Late nodulin [Medicago truncatula]